jgi:hypothetical protein
VTLNKIWGDFEQLGPADKNVQIDVIVKDKTIIASRALLTHQYHCDVVLGNLNVSMPNSGRSERNKLPV